MYLSSAPYHPAREHTINALDRALDIAWPTVDGEPIMSDRDRKAPTLVLPPKSGSGT
jgi:dTDP-4-dehydrorhamnose 3,5-epimerase